jgi:hypothetical protein
MIALTSDRRSVVPMGIPICAKIWRGREGGSIGYHRLRSSDNRLVLSLQESFGEVGAIP